MVKIFSKSSVFFLVLLLLSVTGVIIYLIFTQPLKTYDFYGTKLGFRSDLKQASKIPLYPNDTVIHDILWNQELENLTIVFVNSSENSLVLVEAFEITYKLSLAYNQFDFPVSINAKEVESYDSLNATDYPLIALIPPSLADETAVRLEDNIIYIKGMTKEDFDLATVKFLMIVLGIV